MLYEICMQNFNQIKAAELTQTSGKLKISNVYLILGKSILEINKWYLLLPFAPAQSAYQVCLPKLSRYPSVKSSRRCCPTPRHPPESAASIGPSRQRTSWPVAAACPATCPETRRELPLPKTLLPLPHPAIHSATLQPCLYPPLPPPPATRTLQLHLHPLLLPPHDHPAAPRLDQIPAPLNQNRYSNDRQ